MNTPRRRHIGLVAALAFAAFGYGLMQSFVTPLLPSLREGFGIDEAAAAWLVTGFLLTASVATPIAGRLGDVRGRGAVLRVVLAIFVAASIAAAVAPTFPLLLAARMLQGIGGALFPLAFGLVRERLALSALSGAIGTISSMIAVGSGIAIVVVGPLAELFGYRGVFAVGAAVITAATAVIWFTAPADSRRAAGGLDWIGAVLLAAWLAAALILITQGARWGWISPATIGLSAFALTAAVVWAVVELRSPWPVVNVRLMSSWPVLLANLLAFLFGFLLFGGMVTLPGFVQAPRSDGYGFSATIAQSGLYLLPQTAAFIVVSMLASAMHRRPGERASVVLGAVLATAGETLLVIAHDSPGKLILAGCIAGMGIGLVYTHLAALVVRIVPPSETGSASGVNTNLRNIGGTIGAQLSGAFLVAMPGAAGYGAIFVSLAVVAAASVPIAILLFVALRPRP